ncbi:MAG: DUF507 family protein, partial [Candidatus Acidiferrales bacterium]
GERRARAPEEADPPLMRLSREKTVRLSHRIIDFLVTVDDLDFVEDRDTIRQEIVTILQELLKQEEQVDTEVRAKIASQKKEILEGSEEWDILYRRYYSESLKRMGVADLAEHRR